MRGRKKINYIWVQFKAIKKGFRFYIIDFNIEDILIIINIAIIFNLNLKVLGVDFDITSLNSKLKILNNIQYWMI